MPWLFLIASVVGLSLTANGFWPSRGHRTLLVQSFFAGWLVTEAPLHHLAAQLFVTLACVSEGGLAAFPGWLALALSVVSSVGLVLHYREGQATRHLFERVLSDGLGADYRDSLREESDFDGALPFGRMLVPVWLTDARVRRVQKHVPYADGGRRRTLDIYTAREGVKNAPVLLQIHGGGWSIGHKAQQGRPLIHYMAARGWVVVAINYRLSPRAKWPDHLIDVKLALAWVKEHIAEYGGDPNFVVSTGGSAGGHLSAMLALTPNDPRFQDGPVDTSVRAAIPLYAPYDFCNRAGLQRHPGLGTLLERYVVGKKLEEARELYESGSPLGLVHADAPPFFVVHGTHDSLACVEEARLFAERLRAVSESPVLYAELPRTQHAFEVFHSPRALHTIRAIHRFAEHVYAQYLATQSGARSTSYIRELAPKGERRKVT